MTSTKLDCVGGFMKHWINSVIYYGYNTKGIECFYIVKGSKTREIPYSWELIQDNGLIRAWDTLKTFLSRNYSFAYDYKSDVLIHSGKLGV
jgi:hypothetical protein